MESRIIRRELSNSKEYSEKDVVLFLEKFLKGSLCGDCFSGQPWGEKENERLYFAISEINYGKFVSNNCVTHPQTVAPELLEALEDYLLQDEIAQGYGAGIGGEVQDNARAAINKARGE